MYLSHRHYPISGTEPSHHRFIGGPDIQNVITTELSVMAPMEVTAKVGEAEKTIVFKPTELDGVTPTAQPTSVYVAEIDWLKEDTPTFTGTLTELKIEDKTFTKITFKFAKKE